MSNPKETNRDLVHRFTEAWNEADFERLDGLVTDDYVLHDPSSFFDPSPGLEGIKEVIQGFEAVFPDGHFEIQDMVVEGNLVTVRWIGSGTHTGELFGVEPTGNEFEFDGFEMERIEGNKIAETWTVYDTMGLLQELEVLPEFDDLIEP